MVIDDLKNAVIRGRELHPKNRRLSPRTIAKELFEEYIELNAAMRSRDAKAIKEEAMDVAVVAFRIGCGEYRGGTPFKEEALLEDIRTNYVVRRELRDAGTQLDYYLKDLFTNLFSTTIDNAWSYDLVVSCVGEALVLYDAGSKGQGKCKSFAENL